jgi:pimeloyl-ACP methyl ester carboxylesterase
MTVDRSVLKKLAGAALGLAGAMTLPAYAAKSTAVVSDPAYASAQHLVDIDHGRRLNIYCVGSGSPTVVFDAGLGNWSQIWGLVQPVIAKRTRTCAYDRAGLGFSDPENRDGSSANIVDDLHRLLVGHSYGGMSMRLFADLHFDEVAGMVLVDPSTPDLSPPHSLWPADPTSRAAQDRAQAEQHAERCIAAAEAGLNPDSKDYKECVSEEPNPRYSAAINAVYVHLQKQPSFWKARRSEEMAFSQASADQASAAKRDYGDMPLVVLTQSEAAGPDPAHSGIMRSHDMLAALSRRGVNRLVPESSHSIFFDQPQAVIAAIDDVLDMIANNKP